MNKKKKIVEHIVFPYSKALFELLLHDTEKLNSAQNILLNLSQIFVNNTKLKHIFQEPSLNSEQKQNLIFKLCPEILHFIILKKFIGLLSDKNKLNLIPDIYTIFSELIQEEKNIYPIEIISAKPLEEDLVNQIKVSLENSLKKQIKLNSRIEPDIIGGLIIKTENYVLDNSFKTQLKSIKKNLLELK